MTTETLTTFSALLKRIYMDAFRKAFNEACLGLELAAKTPKEFRGNTEYFGIQMLRTLNPGMRAETQGLPLPGGPTPVQGTATVKAMYLSMEFSHRLMRAASRSEAAFKAAYGYIVEGAFDRMKKHGNIQFLGKGDGVLATISTGGTLAAANASTLQVTVDTTKFLNVGDVVAIWTTATSSTPLTNGGQSDSADKEKVYISSIDSSTLVTLKRSGAATGAATVVANNVILMFGDRQDDGTNNSFTGLGQMADDGTDTSATFEGVSRTTYSNWKGQRIDHSSQNLSRDVIYRLDDRIAEKCGEEADTCITTRAIRREYLNIVQPDTRFQPVKDMDAGYEKKLTMTLGGRPAEIHTDVDCPLGTLFLFPKQLLEFYELTDMELSGETGSQLRQATPYGNTGAGDVFYGYARWEGDFVTEKAPAFGKIVSINYTAE